MKAIIAVYIVALTCGFTHSYSAYGTGSSKRRSGSMNSEQQDPAYAQKISPQYYDRVNSASSYMQPQQQQFISSAYFPQQQAPQQQQKPQQRKVDDRNNYYYQTPQRDFQEPLYGYPTFHGDYDPKPYYFAQPSYLPQEDRMETTNPLDYLQAEIFQENERERNNAAFMQNLALYNQKLDSLQARQQKFQQFENMYNLKPSNEFDDYEIEQPSDWYDQTSIVVDPNSIDNYLSTSSDPQFQYQQWHPHSSDYVDEEVKELRELKQMKQQNKNSAASNKKKSKQQKQQQRKDSYRNLDWQRDMPQTYNNDYEELIEPENYDDEWINWSGQKRSIQPKKVITDIKQAQQSTPAPSTTTTQKSKILEKLQSKITAGQKEVVLPRPANPVRRPFSEAVMKSMGKVSESEESDQQTLPIYKTIKQIIDMEQNLSHVSRTFLILIKKKLS